MKWKWNDGARVKTVTCTWGSGKWKTNAINRKCKWKCAITERPDKVATYVFGVQSHGWTHLNTERYRLSENKSWWLYTGNGRGKSLLHYKSDSCFIRFTAGQKSEVTVGIIFAIIYASRYMHLHIYFRFMEAVFDLPLIRTSDSFAITPVLFLYPRKPWLAVIIS